ncbi:MAG: hypothetical protein HQK65_15840 [Desulfamplus sp.]|nr:hypothetical protein [Desulfamplus sp.]
MILHLLFRTRRFGVNNVLWARHDSLFADPWPRGIARVVKNYKMMKIRAFSGFIPLNDAIKLFPEHAARHGYKPIPHSGASK